MLPKTLPSLVHDLEKEFDCSEGHLPADQITQIPANVRTICRQSKSLHIKDGVEFGQ
jgi:hypothetical protein